MSSIEHLITVADLEKYPDDDGNRYELIEGELYVVTAPGLPHLACKAGEIPMHRDWGVSPRVEMASSFGARVSGRMLDNRETVARFTGLKW